MAPEPVELFICLACCIALHITQRAGSIDEITTAMSISKTKISRPRRSEKLNGLPPLSSHKYVHLLVCMYRVRQNIPVYFEALYLS